jgi:dihydrofolate synthase / folylpolyglutamate synthase
MRTSAYDDAVQALFARQPNRMVPDLDRIRTLLELLDRPEQTFPAFQLTGTNGKTSSAAMVTALLSALGLTAGTYTSPHLQDVRERVRVAGELIGREDFLAGLAYLEPFLAEVDARHPERVTFFEVLTGLALNHFAERPVDVAVVEVGMGGTWDATTVADAKVAVVTPIALDHTDYLGDTLAEIATEKAGIIKPDGFAVIARQPAEAADVVRRRIGEVGAPAAWEGVDFGVRDRQLAVGGQLLSLRGLTGQYDEIAFPLHGEYQAGNAACAVAAVETFVGGGREPLAPDPVRDALGRVGSPGRLEVVRRSPTIMIDAAHNPAGTLALVQAVQEEFSFTRLVGVVAVLADKDVRGMLEELEPVLETVVVTENSSPRRLPVDELGPLADQFFGPERVVRARQLPDAIDAAVGLVEEEAILGGAGVLVTGSVVTAGDARHLLGGPR